MNKCLSDRINKQAIYFDMDGTIANLYGVQNWLQMLRSCDPAPYELAAPMLRLSELARRLNQLQRAGYTLGIVSWLSKNSTAEYDVAVTKAKLNWLRLHLKSVCFDEIHIVKYGTPKSSVVKYPQGVLFDDEEKNRKEWQGIAYNVNNIIQILKSIDI